MKKLVIAAAVVCAAACVQAASFTWKTTANAMGPAVDLANLTAGHVDAGSTAMKNMSGVTWTYIMTLSNDSGASDSLEGSIAYSMSKIQVKDLSSDVMWKPSSATDDSNYVDYSIIITGTYKDAKGVDWTFKSDAIAETGVEFGSMTTLEISSAVPSGWTVSSAAAPEPTSGLLLLLGMAGLALKRKRA